MGRIRIVTEEIEEIETKFVDTEICPECKSMMVVTQYGLYFEAICKGCGRTETSNRNKKI